MRPVRTARSNMTWTAPPESPEVRDLHAEVDPEANESRSVWWLSPEDRAAIARGANVRLTIVGRQPPVSLTVTDEQGVGEDHPAILARIARLRI